MQESTVQKQRRVLLGSDVMDKVGLEVGDEIVVVADGDEVRIIPSDVAEERLLEGGEYPGSAGSAPSP